MWAIAAQRRRFRAAGTDRGRLLGAIIDRHSTDPAPLLARPSSAAGESTGHAGLIELAQNGETNDRSSVQPANTRANPPPPHLPLRRSRYKRPSANNIGIVVRGRVADPFTAVRGCETKSGGLVWPACRHQSVIWHIIGILLYGP